MCICELNFNVNNWIQNGISLCVREKKSFLSNTFVFIDAIDSTTMQIDVQINGSMSCLH